MSMSDTNQSSNDRERELRDLSFSQAQGYQGLPRQLKLEELPQEARVHIWNLFYVYLDDSAERVRSPLSSSTRLGQNWKNILWQVHLWHDNMPLDEWDSRYDVVCDNLKSRIHRLPFNEVFDLIQFVIRQSECPAEFTTSMRNAFSHCRLAYTITEDPPPTIVPAVSKTEGDAIVTSLNELNVAGLTGSASHLRKSAECINRSEWADSIRESIHAVESVVRQIAPGKSRTLTQALKSIDKDGSLHPALIEACKKLYGYTSDEQGVRHPLLDRKVSRVSRDEAVFMLGACASFASYLWRKHAAGEAS